MVACDTRGPRFESRHQRILQRTFIYCQLYFIENTNIIRKWGREWTNSICILDERSSCPVRISKLKTVEIFSFLGRNILDLTPVEECDTFDFDWKEIWFLKNWYFRKCWMGDGLGGKVVDDDDADATCVIFFGTLSMTILRCTKNVKLPTMNSATLKSYQICEGQRSLFVCWVVMPCCQYHGLVLFLLKLSIPGNSNGWQYSCWLCRGQNRPCRFFWKTIFCKTIY